MPRKHLIASVTNKKQQLNAARLTKASREIRAAVRVGGPSPDANPRLRYAIERALAANMTRESVQKNIAGNRNEALLEEMDFEAFGPHGVAIVIHAVSDNVNRTAGNIRGYLTKMDSQLAKPNAARTQFRELGQIAVAKAEASEESLLTAIGDAPVDDIVDVQDGFLLLCEPSAYEEVAAILRAAGVATASSEIGLYPLTTVAVDDEKALALLEAFERRCDDDEDISWVVTNRE